jgi:hypothetical protein
MRCEKWALELLETRGEEMRHNQPQRITQKELIYHENNRN